MPESTAVYPTKYYAEHLKDTDFDPRFYVDRKVVVTVPGKNPNTDFSPEAIVLPGFIKRERLFESTHGEQVPRPLMIEVHLPSPISKSVLDITSKDLQHIMQADLIEELGADSKIANEEVQRIRRKLLSWIDEKAEGEALQLTEEAKSSLMRIIALVMKKTDDLLKQSKG